MTPVPLHFFNIHPFCSRLVFSTTLEQPAPWVVSAEFEDAPVEEDIESLSVRLAKEAFDQVIGEDPALADTIPSSLYARAVESIREDMSHVLGGLVEGSREGANTGDQMRSAIRRFASRIAKRVCESLPLDPLTGLPNRGALDQRLKEEIARSSRTGGPLSLLMFDLDKFKEVNDQYGHPKGDEVLRQLSHRFRHGEIGKSIMREYDFVARFGGDEMVFLLPETNEEESIMVAHRIAEALQRDPVYVDINGTLVKADIGASIGIGVFTGKEKDPMGERMFEDADYCLLMLKGERKDSNGEKIQRRGQIAVNGKVYTHDQVEQMIRSADEVEAGEAEKAQEAVVKKRPLVGEAVTYEDVERIIWPADNGKISDPKRPQETVAPDRPFVFGPK